MSTILKYEAAEAVPIDAEEDLSPERITTITNELASKMDKAIRNIEKINLQSNILAVNAKVESARAGTAGASFAVVASEMGVLSQEIAELVKSLEKESSKDFKEIARINDYIATSFRGTRLSDIALTNIDLIDRNLYERSCDVRWWATDQSVVGALEQKTAEAYKYASHRLGVILDSYTVYYDLVLADQEGNIVANGRPNKYQSVGNNVVNSKWFKAAMSCASGEDYGSGAVHHSKLVNNELALVFTTAVRAQGNINGPIIGALGIIFRYESLAQVIVENVPLSEDEREKSRVCIVDDSGLLLADSKHQTLQSSIDFKGRENLFNEKKGYIIEKFENTNCCIAHAKAPGFETFTTGWHSLIIQKM